MNFKVNFMYKEIKQDTWPTFSELAEKVRLQAKEAINRNIAIINLLKNKNNKKFEILLLEIFTTQQEFKALEEFRIFLIENIEKSTANMQWKLDWTIKNKRTQQYYDEQNSYIQFATKYSKILEFNYHEQSDELISETGWLVNGILK